MSHFLFVAGTLRERSSPESASLQLTHGLWGCCTALIRDNLTTLMVTHSMHQAAYLGDRLIMMVRGKVIHDIRGADKQRLTPEDLLDRFDEVRRAELLDESAAEMLERQYV